MSARFDVAIVGAGHNGLVCGAYLAAAGLSVVILERRPIVGGAAVTQEFHPGFRNSTFAYTVSLLDPQVIRDLGLAGHGLSIAERPLANFLPLSARPGDCLAIGATLAATQAEVARFSARDAQRLPSYYAMLGRAADRLRPLLHRTPPAMRADASSLLDALRALRAFRRLLLAERRDIVELLTRSAGDLLDGWFESEPVKAALAFESVVGNFASPYAGGGAYLLLHHAFGEVNGRRGQWGHAIGGMGSITQAMAKACAARGVAIRTAAPVVRVIVKDRRAAGVALASGEVVEASCVAANVNPKLLFGQLLEREHVDDDFRARIERYRCASGTFRMNVALSALPDFACRPGREAQPHHASGIVVAPSLGYMERAYADARTHGWSREPIVELMIPSLVDDTLAPRGMHVASLFCQHVHPRFESVFARPWDDARGAVADTMIDAVDRLAPGFKASVIAREAYGPLDLECELGMVGGDIWHGAMSLDQLFVARPVLGHANYRMPLRGLYVCGSGAHPGGGVSGIPGRNAAREIVRDLRRGLRRRAKRLAPHQLR